MDEFDPRPSPDGMTFIRGNIRVEWEDIGEGLDGDYNPDNPEDAAEK